MVKTATIYEGVLSQWKPAWDKNLAVVPLKSLIAQLGDAAGSLAAANEKHSSSGKLTRAGVLEKVRAAAATDAVPVLCRAHHIIDRAKAAVAERRARLLAPNPIDKTDFAAALLRQEIRANMARMDEPARMALLQNSTDPRVWDAYQELPTFAPVPADFMDRLQEQRIEAMDGTAVEQMREANEALAMVSNLLAVAIKDVRDTAGFEHAPREFDSFMKENSAAVEAEFRTKPPAPDVDLGELSGIIKSLSHRDRGEMIDLALDRQMQTLGEAA